ncbi:MAG: MBOAT family O-acyltransferase [Aestuariivirga sp.]
MLFSELQFFVFFSGYLLLHLIVPAKHRIYLVIAGGSVFYSWWRLDYLWVPYLLTALAFIGVSWMEAANDPHTRRKRLIAVVALILAPLIVIKYSYFIAANFASLLDRQNMVERFSYLKFSLPLGISFITFTAIAYVVDVYRRRYLPEKKISIVLAYVMFFPHLIAGPILRPHELMPQLKQLRTALGARFLTGAGIFTLGLFKKLAIADQLAVIVEPVFAQGANPSAFEYILAIYGFSAQIYCDFSGYTDMAIGLAYILRIRLPTNFLRPYSATSIIDFWRRWHITLSHWLRDYIYVSLGGNRSGSTKRNINLLLTMAIGGFWHGANWTFLVWGLLHGCALVIVHRFRVLGIRLPQWLAVVITFHFVTLAWIFFRAADLTTAFRVLGGPFIASWESLFMDINANSFAFALMALFFLTHRFDRHALVRFGMSRISWAITVPFLAFLWTVAFTLSQGSSAKFIYFDF